MPDRPSWPNCSSIGWISTAFSSVVVARSADIGVEDRHAIDGRPLRSLAIELVVEDGAHRTVGQGGRDLESRHRAGIKRAQYADSGVAQRELRLPHWEQQIECIGQPV